MSEHSKRLEVGARVVTTFSGRITVHHITKKIITPHCQSGVMFEVEPPVPKSSGGDAKMDADWFQEWK
jgi:hypothetical protein